MGHRSEIAVLIKAVRSRYGLAYAPYGTSGEEQNGTGFRIEDIPATFSALCLEDTPHGQYDIQIESYPPGDYIYTDIVRLDQLLSLIERFRKPIEYWPTNHDRDA
jgi:hypothetical protein